MSLTMAVFTFIVAWWVLLFIVLPLGIEKADHPGKMEYAAAPKRIRWGKILFITTLMAVIMTGIIALVIHSGWISVRDY